MNNKISSAFLFLVLAQALHSIEEYLGSLWEVFPPATWLTSQVSSDLHLGFLIINIGLFLVGILVWFSAVRREHFTWKFFVWFWIILELTNGVGHIAWSVYQMDYTPGLLTAPLLLILAFKLLNSVRRPTV